jgi:predicted  nucleic acid-binding Zn-ribbon protein
MSQIDNLVRLQNLDSQLMEIEEILGDLPDKVAELKATEDQLVKDVEAGHQRILEIQVALNKAEITVAQETEKIETLKEQLYQVTTNKAYDALMSEIDHMKNKLDEDETLDLELMEEKDELEKTLKEKESNLDSLRTDLQDRRASLELLLEESAEQKAALEKDREAAVKAVDPARLQHYNRVSRARKGLAVVPIESHSCGGCGLAVQPQKQAEIRAKKVLHTCDECSRFLYWESD